MSSIYLLRHGQASFGSDDYDNLSPLGVEQSRMLGASFAKFGLQEPVFVCGGMRRHRQTLEAFFEGFGAAHPFEVKAGWNEFDHLAVMRVAYPEYVDPAVLRAAITATPNPMVAFQRLFETAMERWASGKPDYPETWAAFLKRVAGAFEELTGSLPSDRDAVVSTSGGAITAVVQQLLQIPSPQAVTLSWTLVNAGYTHVLTKKRGTRLCCFNVHTHFQGEPRLLTYR